MTIGSAFLGAPPNNAKDVAIIIGLQKLSGASTLNPSAGAPLGPHRPKNANNDTRGPAIIAACSVLMALIILVTTARILVRVFHKRMKFGLDDMFIIPAALFGVAWMAVTISLVKYANVGQHTWNLTYENMGLFFKLGATNQAIFYCASALVQASIILFNRRLTGVSSKPWQIVHWVLLFCVFVYWATSFFTTIFVCNPTTAGLSLEGRGRATHVKCLDATKLQLAFSIMHVILDFSLLAVPVTVLVKSQLAWTTKLRLCFLFTLGLLSCISAVMRVVTGNQKRIDFAYDSIKQIEWVMIDISSAIIVASLPALNALLDLIIPTKWSVRRRTVASTSKGSSQNKHTPPTTLGSKSTNMGSTSDSMSSNSHHKHTEDKELAFFTDEEMGRAP